MEAHGKIVHGNVIVENKVIENECLEMTCKEFNYLLGPELTLRHCTLVLKVAARALLLRQVRFIDCTFDIKQELKNHQQWVRTSIEGGRFKGRLSGCDFGDWPEYWGDGKHGSIQDCDFSEARLDSCRFIGCDERTLRFPRWPCFTFLDPIGHAAALRAVAWPGLFGRVIVDQLHTHPPATRALTYHAPTIARDMETTPEALRSLIERFDCIVY